MPYGDGHLSASSSVSARSGWVPTLSRLRTRVSQHCLRHDRYPDDFVPDTEMTYTRGRCRLVTQWPSRAVKRLAHGRITGWRRRAAHALVVTGDFADVTADRGLPQPDAIQDDAVLARFNGLPPLASARAR
jgi:hypothetical protein